MKHFGFRAFHISSTSLYISVCACVCKKVIGVNLKTSHKSMFTCTIMLCLSECVSTVIHGLLCILVHLVYLCGVRGGTVG